ncbi:hypothetical protein QOZ80_3BG0264910 [Eleusine coracana subsp. coracana]|nr:hypothetical protein QOZ80_3BG0264910 [Eleusine coracana subsp. coracana]
MSMARSIDRRNLAALAQGASRVPLRGKGLLTTPALTAAAPGSSTAVPPPPGVQPSTVTVAGRSIRRLTPAEIDERRRKDQCFNCDEKWERGHNKVCKRLFHLELVDNAEPAEMEDEPHISVYAITGVSIGETMQMVTHMGSAMLTALLDSGSTHNFVSEAAATAAGLTYTTRPGLHVMVANGERIPCSGVLHNVAFSINDAPFRADFYILPLGGYDVVLGTKWLATLGPILWDFGRLTMAFQHLDRRVEWHGATGPLCHREYNCQGVDLLDGLLGQTNFLFRWWMSYWMNSMGQLSSPSLISVPATIKHVDDIEKTAFRTHEDLYEFLVMPFGLSNAPATFQALMNEVLRPFLRKFVLVFFDDILIYSPSWSSHLCHLRAVLEVLRSHQLYVKRSKCSFAESSVGYLGHVVSADGVAMDSSKIQSMVDWPVPRSVRALRGFLGLAGYYQVRAAYDSDPAMVALKAEVDAGTRGKPWSLRDGLVMYNDRVYIPPSSALLPTILTAVHDGTHEGVQKTLHRLRRDFHTPNARIVVQDFVRSCDTCQRYKTEHLHLAGLLTPLPVPTAVWADVTMDFVEGLPKVGGKSVILTVVDRFSKYAHFIALAHPYTAESVARVFFAEIVQLHGIPVSITSDRDPVFTSAFWKELFMATGSKLNFSTAFHPQTDGQSEAVNKAIAMYLRCLTGDRPRNWIQWLPWAEYVYNTSFHTALRDTPFKVVYGREPPSLQSYEPGDLRVSAVIQTLAERDEFLQDVRSRLAQAQQLAKSYYDGHHREVIFEVGDWVWLRLCHRFPTGVPDASQGKLRPRFFGPFKIIANINDVAYKLQLPAAARIHDVFHVGLLKKFVGEPPATLPDLPPIHNGAIIRKPHRAIRVRLCRGIRQVLVQWSGHPASEASWEDLALFQTQYPAFQLEDELLVEGGRDVMWGRHYSRKKRVAEP